MTGRQWRMAARILAVLESDVGRTDQDLADAIDVTLAELRPVIGALYKQRKIDRCWDYVVLASRSVPRERAA